MNKPLVKFALPWQDCLVHEQGLKQLLERAKKHDALTYAVKQAVYSLGFESVSQSLLLEWRPDRPNELILVVPNATIGTRLQQITPSITKALDQHQWAIHQIRIKVKPSHSPRNLTRGDESPPEFSEAAQAAWEGLYQQLSPHSMLGQSIERLLKNRKSKR